MCSITFSNCGHAWIILEGGMKEGEREKGREGEKVVEEEE